MSETYGNLPTFSAGQVLSASAHLNAVQRYLTLVHDDVAGVSTPAYGSSTMVIRHQWPLLEYSIIHTQGTVTISFGGIVIRTITSGGAQSGTVDLTSWNFTVDQFYNLTLTGGVEIIYLRERQTTSYPALASFANDTTPTAAQWQALTDYAALIGDALDVPQPVNTRQSGIPGRIYYHSLVHRGNRLKIHFRVSAPYNCQSIPRFTRVQVFANSTLVFSHDYGAFTNVNTEIDLSGAGLTLGTSYDLTLVTLQSSDCDYDGDFFLFAMYEIPAVGDGVVGWVPLKEWRHGDWVWGSVNPVPDSKKIQTIKADLVTLSTAVSEVCYASPMRTSGHVGYEFLYGIRRRRFLHYKTFVGQNCTINWQYRGEDQQVSLPESSGVFMAADMDSLEGLFPGTAYWIGGTKCAIEDSHA